MRAPDEVPVGPRARTTFRVLTLLYFASGAVALVDEVVFFKYLSLAFGATAQASSAVLVAFMAGLALGAALAARADRRVARPLLVYGALELAVGAACAAAPWLFAAVARAYVALAAGTASPAALELMRGALAGAVVLLPTLAMGATLPLVARVAGAAEGGDRRVAVLYGANTAGGALGSLLGVYAVVPALGLAGSLRAGACASAAIGVAAMLLGRAGDGPRRAAVAEADAPARPAAARHATGAMIASAASGLLVFSSEVVFVHLLALVDGTSVYVFGLVLAVFLVALAGGAALSRVLVGRLGALALPGSLALGGLSLAATMPVWDRLPDLFVAAGPLLPAFWQREVVRGVAAAIAIGVPALCMGTTFPVVLAALADGEDRGARIGQATAVNTIASIAGSILGGFVLVPLLGSQRACGAIAVAYGLAALAVPAPERRWTAVVAAATGLLVVALPRWDLARLASGTNVYFERQREQGDVVWIDEDVHGGVVTVTRAGGIDTLWTNGKYQGDTGWQMTPQKAFADVPAMFAPRYGRALVVGVGTGTTLGELATYPFERIDVAELSPGIVEAARRFFRGVNGGVFDDPRVFVRYEDGRNLLLVEPGTYDLVTIELTSIWFAGAANLYNREFYEVAARKLSEGGVLSQWIQLHHTTLLEIASQMATARAVFAHAAFFVRGQGLLELSQAPLRAHPRPAARPARGAAATPTSAASLDDLVLADDTMDAFIDDVCARFGVRRSDLVSTDDNLRLEYATPRDNVPALAATQDLREWRRPEVAARVGAR